MRQEIRFDEFRVRLDPPSLCRNGDQIPLTPKEAATLGVLLEARGAPVAAADLVQRVWNGAPGLDDSNVRQQIRSLRKKLGKRAGGTDYIVTVPRQGYRLVADVVELSDEVDETSAGIERAAYWSVARFRGWAIGTLAILAAAACGYFTWEHLPSEVQIVESRQLTRDGLAKAGGPFTDGSKVYFGEVRNGRPAIASVALAGGNVEYLDLPIDSPALLAILPARHSLLLSAAWQLYELPIGSRSPRLLPAPAGLKITSAAASFADDRVAAASGDVLTIFRPGALSSMAQWTVPGLARVVGWEPGSRSLLLDSIDGKSETSSWWEIEGNNPKARRLSRFSPHPVEDGGAWTNDGFLVFAAGIANRGQLWVADTASKPSRAYRLTVDSRRWQSPAVIPGGRRVVAYAGQMQGQLATLTGGGKSNAEKSLLAGPSGYEVDYSPDGQWAAYAQFPEHTIWRCRIGGGEARQLSPAGIDAHQPHWSADGTRIAFLGRAVREGNRSRIYVVSSAGGNVDQPLPQGDDQGVPTWSADGRSLIFGDVSTRSGFEHATIHKLDLQSQRVFSIDAPVGMWSPRLSPDGKYLAAVSFDNRSLYIRDNARNRWQSCVTMAFLEEPVWRKDSSWVQFIGSPQPGSRVLARIGPNCQAAGRTIDLSAYEFVGDTWIGIGVDGAPLGLLKTADEIYALDWRLLHRLP